MSKRKIFIAVAFGTSVRDVLRNDTFEVLKKCKNLEIVVLAQDVESDLMKEFAGPNIYFENLFPYQASFCERLLANFYKAILRDKCRTIDLGNTSGDTRVLDWLTPLAHLAKKVCKYETLNKYIYLMFRVFARPKLYNSLFEKYKPDLVVVTRVLNFSADYPLMRMAYKKNVPIVSLVSSWDNLTSKGFFPFEISSLVVWNEVMKAEAINLFAFPEKKIFISGIPRYDLFFRKLSLRNREKFCQDFGLDPRKKLIVYATGSRTTGRTALDPISPEPGIVKYIADQIKNEKFSYPAQLLVRLHPQADPNEYKELVGRNDILVHVPGIGAKFQDRLFSRADDCELAETMSYADVVVNLASTMTIDAAVFDTPIICINFDFWANRPYRFSVNRLYDFDHYAKLKETGGFLLCNSKEELVTQIDNYLQFPSLLSENRLKIVQQQCKFTDGKSGERVAQHIMQMLEIVS